MNRRTIFSVLLAAPAAVFAAFRAKASPFSATRALKLTNEQLRGEPCFPKSNPYRSGMRLRVVGQPPEFGPFAAHAVSLTPGCVTDAATGLPVTNISSMVVFLNANGWMDAIVTVTPRDEYDMPRRAGNGILRTRHSSPVDLDLTVRSESVADHAERLRRMGDAIQAADHALRPGDLVSYVGGDEWATSYREARRMLDEIGGV